MDDEDDEGVDHPVGVRRELEALLRQSPNSATISRERKFYADPSGWLERERASLPAGLTEDQLSILTEAAYHLAAHFPEARGRLSIYECSRGIIHELARKLLVEPLRSRDPTPYVRVLAAEMTSETIRVRLTEAVSREAAVASQSPATA